MKCFGYNRGPKHELNAPDTTAPAQPMQTVLEQRDPLYFVRKNVIISHAAVGFDNHAEGGVVTSIHANTLFCCSGSKVDNRGGM